MLKHLLLTALFGGFLCLGAPIIGPGVANAQSCLSPAQAREAVQQGQVVPLSQLRGRITQEAGGEVVSAQLCQAGGEYVYLVNVLSAAGEVKRLTVSAGNGNILDNRY